METAKLVLISPRRAEQMLNKNTQNRKLREGVAEKYAHDMKHGRWTQCIAPIAIYEDGNIADGQHRLWAIVEAKTPQKFYVIHGVKREDGFNIDNGIPRNIIDNARIAGRTNSEHMTTETVSLARAIEQGDRASANLSFADRMDMFEKHYAAVQWACRFGAHGRYLRNAVVNGAIARAWYAEEDKERLAKFGEVLSSGLTDSADDWAAITLRNMLLSDHVMMHTGAAWKDSFKKCQRAIYNFMRRKPLKVLKMQSEECYPLKKVKK